MVAWMSATYCRPGVGAESYVHADCTVSLFGQAVMAADMSVQGSLVSTKCALGGGVAL
jgi:hypothetical protein